MLKNIQMIFSIINALNQKGNYRHVLIKPAKPNTNNFEIFHEVTFSVQLTAEFEATGTN